MSFQYAPASTAGALRQGEIVGPIWGHQPLFPPIQPGAGQQLSVRSTLHELAVVLSPDCDLLWDHEVRFAFDPDRPPDALPVDEHPSAVTHVLLCDLFSRDLFRPRFKGQPDLWRRVEQNQDERYHHLPGAPIGDGDRTWLHELFVDFKKALAIPTSGLYDGILGDHVERVAVIPDVYIHDLIHRFYGFLSRIALPDS